MADGGGHVINRATNKYMSMLISMCGNTQIRQIMKCRICICKQTVLIQNSIAADGIWSNSAKGERSPDILVNNTFGTLDLVEIYQKILKEGKIQLTSQQRKEMVEQKRKQIVAHIVANAMNPQTGGAHPPQRIENAI